MSSGDDSSAKRTATKYAQSTINPYTEVKEAKEATFLSSPDTIAHVSSPYDHALGKGKHF